MSEESKTSAAEGLRQAGGLVEGASREVARAIGVPEAQVYGVGTFYHLLSQPDAKLRVCTGLTCMLAGAEDLLEAARGAGLPVAGCSCLAGCDVAPAMLRD